MSRYVEGFGMDYSSLFVVHSGAEAVIISINFHHLTLLCLALLLYCTVLYCTVLYCTVLYCTVLYCTVLYCTVLYCIICALLNAHQELHCHQTVFVDVTSSSGTALTAPSKVRGSQDQHLSRQKKRKSHLMDAVSPLQCCAVFPDGCSVQVRSTTLRLHPTPTLFTGSLHHCAGISPVISHQCGLQG